MLMTGEAYQEKGVDYFTDLDQQDKERRLTRQLERLENRSRNAVLRQP
jgi:hypothetical protein